MPSRQATGWAREPEEARWGAIDRRIHRRDRFLGSRAVDGRDREADVQPGVVEVAKGHLLGWGQPLDLRHGRQSRTCRGSSRGWYSRCLTTRYSPGGTVIAPCSGWSSVAGASMIRAKTSAAASRTWTRGPSSTW